MALTVPRVKLIQGSNGLLTVTGRPVFRFVRVWGILAAIRNSLM
jgi:hypothetical protein